MTETVTAAILVIGDEILSGRTKDRNIGYIAEYCTAIGIDTKEVRVVPDEEDEIIPALDALRAKYDYVFTTGGIGPTHDDITADCIAKAFGVSIDVDPRARAMLLERIPEKDLNEARLRMARIPLGAELIENPVSKAPGFMIGNVITMAGVPSVMQAMLDVVAPRLKTGTKMLQVSIEAPGLKEGDIGTPYGSIAKAHPGVIMGSYPMMQDGKFWTRLVLRAKDPLLLAAAEIDVVAMVETHKPATSAITVTRGA
jgi:molybdenum cofactor synthesis domain-containing protein